MLETRLINLSPALIAFFLLLALRDISGTPILTDSDQDPQFGGIEAIPHEFPWQVSLEWKGGPACSGVIISSLVVLTSASCADLVAVSSIYVLVGRHNLNDSVDEQNVKKLSVSRIVKHPDYPAGPRGQWNDISIFKMVYPIEFNEDVQPISINPEGQVVSGTAIVSGWGSRAEEAISPSESLMKSNVAIVSDSDCKVVYGQDFDEDSMICAGNLGIGGADFCTGDTGGPLVVEKEDGSYKLIGISSWGYGCGQPNFPGVYTEVSHFQDFIQQNS